MSGQIPAEPRALLLAPLPQPAPRCAGLGIGPSSSSGCPVTVPRVTLPAQPALPPPVPPLESTRPGPRCSANATRGALRSPGPVPEPPCSRAPRHRGDFALLIPLPWRPPPLEALQREGGKKKNKKPAGAGDMSSAEEDYNFVFKGEEETSPPCLHPEDGVGGGRGCAPSLVFPKLGWGWGLPLCPSSKPSVLQRGFGTGGLAVGSGGCLAARGGPGDPLPPRGTG